MTDTAPTPKKNADLPVRFASAVVMLAVAGTALWLGGWVWLLLVSAVAIGVLWEWTRLARIFSSDSASTALWVVAGVAYVLLSGFTLLELRAEFEGAGRVLLVVGAVVGTDVGAYFAGRAIGGPKIAPKISPSKTWAGLAGGMVGASITIGLIATWWDAGLCEFVYPPPELDPQGKVFTFDGPCSGIMRFYPPTNFVVWAGIFGSIIAIVAQSGDFFESWMKRRAGVKDSSNLIPGHGGVFDRVDGLLAVCFVLGIFGLISGNFR